MSAFFLRHLQVDYTAEQPLHLPDHVGADVPVPAAIAGLDPQCGQELVQASAEHQPRGLRSHRFGADPREEQSRVDAVGQAVVRIRGVERQHVVAGASDVLALVPHGAAGEGADRQHEVHETDVALACVDDLVELALPRVVVAALGRLAD